MKCCNFCARAALAAAVLSVQGRVMGAAPASDNAGNSAYASEAGGAVEGAEPAEQPADRREPGRHRQRRHGVRYLGLRRRISRSDPISIRPAEPLYQWHRLPRQQLQQPLRHDRVRTDQRQPAIPVLHIPRGAPLCNAVAHRRGRQRRLRQSRAQRADRVGASAFYGYADKLGAGTLEVNRIRAGGIAVDEGVVRITANGTTAGLSIANTLSVDANATLDLTDNDLVVNNGVFGDIQTLVLAGFGNTTGITSSTSNGTQILALFDNALVGSSDWEGQPISPNAIVGKYTYMGDVNFDGQVTGDDYTIVDSNLNTDPAVGIEWLSGDANLDGIVTGDDYTIIDSNLGLGVGSPLAPSSIAVPEPSSLVLAWLGALMLQRRRRWY